MSTVRPEANGLGSRRLRGRTGPDERCATVSEQSFNDARIGGRCMDGEVVVLPRRSARKAFAGVAEGRRRNMQANRSKNTRPELAVRKLLHSMGYRFRIHVAALPGKPDIAFTRRKKIIEVRGCFWHGHGCRPLGQLPVSRTEYWGPKIAATKTRDTANENLLRELGWSVLVVWECRLRAEPDRVRNELVRFIGEPKSGSHSG